MTCIFLLSIFSEFIVMYSKKRYHKSMTTLKPNQIISYIAPHLPKNPVIVEAGAFTGTETLRLARQFAQSPIYSFEPVPELFEILQKNCAGLSQITCHQAALSKTSGIATLHLSHKPETPHKISQANSLRAPKERLERSPIKFGRTISVPTFSLDDWTTHNKIKQIDLLWLDTQGHEKSILEGAAHILPSIKVIVTEVGFVEAYQGQTLFEQLTVWLAQRHFSLLATDFVLPSNWFFGNAVYIKTHRQET